MHEGADTEHAACLAYRGSIEDHAKGLQQRHYFRGDQVEPDTAHADAERRKACVHPANQIRLNHMLCLHIQVAAPAQPGPVTTTLARPCHAACYKGCIRLRYVMCGSLLISQTITRKNTISSIQAATCVNRAHVTI